MRNASLHVKLVHLFDLLTQWADPWWWVAVSIIIFLLLLVHPVPWTLEPGNHSTKAHVSLWVRRSSVFAMVGLVLFYPLLTFALLATATNEPNAVAFTRLVEWITEMFYAYWTAPLAAVLGGLLITLSWHRYLDPYVSNLLRTFRVKQREDVPSDVRAEASKLQPVNFKPEQYFQPGYYFTGLDNNGAPIYSQEAEFHETHKAVIGPTRSGKGVVIGVWLAQSVQKGNCVIYVDPKGDKNIPYILQQEARKANRPFIYLDLNPDGKGHWHPFKGGAARDRRSRALDTFRLQGSGTDADVFKAKERAQLDDALAHTDGSIKQLLGHIAAANPDGLSQLRDGLREWSKVSTFMPPKGRGHSIEESLKNGAVVYVKGSITDSVVRAATRAYIAEVVQELIRLAPVRRHHATMAVDEVRFVISNELINALATVAGFNADMIVATQAFSDLTNVDDDRINGKALARSFEVNCQLKVLYRAGDDLTAEWGEMMSGTQQLRLPKMERTETNRWGGEKWGEMRALERVEAPLISRNVFLMLQPRVAVFYRPSSVPSVVFTAWMDADRAETSWQKKGDEPATVEPNEGASNLISESDAAGKRAYIDLKGL